MSKSYKEIMNGIRAFVLDVDGVLTDSSVLITTTGEVLRTMNIRDGYAIREAVQQGFRVAVISGGSNEGVRKRLESLGVTDIELGVPDKLESFTNLLQRYGLEASSVLYMGDDIPDFPAMQLAGLAACPQDAAPEIKAVCTYVSHRNGGHGAARDVIEQVLKVQGKWMDSFNAKCD